MTARTGMLLGRAGYLAQAIGHVVIQQGYRVLYLETHKLLEELTDATQVGVSAEASPVIST